MSQRKKYFFNNGEKGNVEIIGSGRAAEFADQTLYAQSCSDKDAYSMATIHLEGDVVRFTSDGKPFYGGSFVMESKEAAIAKAESMGFTFEPKSKAAFLAA
jgi:hypothetical protein